MKQVKPTNKRLVSSDRSRRVLAIVGDTQVGLWVVRSLARNGLTVHAIVNTPQGQSAHSRYPASAWTLEARPGEPGFNEEILGLIRDLDVGSVMPVSEGYHNRLISLRDELGALDVHLFSPSREAFDKATDKDAMHALCVELGVPVARGMRLDELMAQGGAALRFPLVLRTRQQNVPGGKLPSKAAYAETPEQLEKLHDTVRDCADNVIVQEYHPGAEDHVQIVMHDGEAVGWGDYIGEHHMPLAGGVTVQRISCNHEPMVQHAIRLLQAIDYEGVAGVQFHYDTATDQYIFLEINPRFSGGLPTVILAGFEAPFLVWQSRFEPGKMQRGTYRLGLRTRILGGDANWVLGHIRGDPLPPGHRHLGKLAAIGTFLWNCGPWTKDDSFLWSDPKPFFVDFKQMLKKLGARGHEIVN